MKNDQKHALMILECIRCTIEGETRDGLATQDEVIRNLQLAAEFGEFLAALNGTRSLTAVGLLLQHLEELLASFYCLAPLFYRISVIERWHEESDTSGLRMQASSLVADLRRFFAELEEAIQASTGEHVRPLKRPFRLGGRRLDLESLFEWMESPEGSERLDPYDARNALDQLFSHLLAIRHELWVDLEEMCRISRAPSVDRRRPTGLLRNKPRPISDPFLGADLVDAMERKGHTARQAVACMRTTPETLGKLLRGEKVADRTMRSAIQYAYSGGRTKGNRTSNKSHGQIGDALIRHSVSG